jgi:hypothetical protein
LGHRGWNQAVAVHTIQAASLIDVIPSVLRRGGLPTLAALATTLAIAPPASVRAATLFAAADVDQQRFVLVAAPIGTKGERSQLNIYEQLKTTRPCFEVAPGSPAAVNPLLATFDFTGICNRYIDANGYSVRVGNSDLATSYRLMVTRTSGDLLLVAFPTRAGAGPEMVVARSRGEGGGFLKLEMEPGWRLMRRQFGGRNLGHLYVYSEAWPAGVAATAASSSSIPPAAGVPATVPPAKGVPTMGAPAPAMGTTAPVAPARQVPAAAQKPTTPPSIGAPSKL